MRLLNLTSVHNFRDFGDYTGHGGRQVQPRKLFRSAHLSGTNEAELSQIEALNISLVVDLRHTPERDRQPNKWPGGNPVNLVEYPDKPGGESAKTAPHEAFMQNKLHTPEDARGYMRGSYAARPHDEGFVSSFSKTLKFMAAEGKPLLIHCTAGKDRTGTLAAVILSSLGVDRDTIMEDYMLTMTAVDIESLLEPAAKMMSKRFGRTMSPDALRPFFSVEPSYLQESLDAIDDMESYIFKTLGVTDAELTALRDNYLA